MRLTDLVRNSRTIVPLGARRPQRRRARKLCSARRLRVEALEPRWVLSAFTVVNTDDSGPGSLRQAILDANATANVDTTGDGIADPDVIAFDIPGNGPHAIRPLSPLPDITDPVVIDGWTQPGSQPNSNLIDQPVNAVYGVELDGSLVEPGTWGLTIAAGGSTVRGLVINRFAWGGWAANRGGGVFVTDHGGNVLEGLFLGTDATGSAAQGNGYGISVEVAGNSVGGSTPAARNLIAGNALAGLSLGYATGGNVVQGNFIGTNATGAAALGNGWVAGVSVYASSDNQIGGTAPQARNVISGNSTGILIQPSSSSDSTLNRVVGNYIGTDPSGMTAVPNGTGVDIFNASNNVIGGTTEAERNIISGNNGVGVYIHKYPAEQAATGNLVQGNYIGTDVTGTAALGNLDGVQVDPHDNFIGGLTDTPGTGPGNLISGNQRFGVFVGGHSYVQGNLIGTDKTGTLALPNLEFGIRGTGVIGGTTAAARNIISGNGGGIDGYFAVIQGNYIGTDITGTRRLGSQHDGVRLSASSLLGGTDPGAGNLVSGNNLGVRLFQGPSVIEGNLIGTDWTGEHYLLDENGNSTVGNGMGIYIADGAHDNRIGGTTPAARNIISANTIGISIVHATTTRNRIEGNYIGPDITGVQGLGNYFGGISIQDASHNTVGGLEPGAGNVIAFNQGFPGWPANSSGYGVAVTYSGSPFSAGNAIVRNSIFANGGLGIDLSMNGGGTGDGPTPNDAGDADAGPNGLQNFPELSAASWGPSSHVQGSLHSSPNTAFVVDFYANASPDPSGYGEGQRWLGSTLVTTDGSGAALFDAPVSSIAEGEFVTATATDSTGNTSEFSLAIEALVRTVQIDVTDRPTNVASDGVIQVAVLSTLGFDASQIAVGSVVFAGAQAVQSALRDVDGDGTLDLVLHFRVQDTTLAAIYQELLEDDVDADGVLDSNHQTASVSLTGELVDQTLIDGFDQMDLFLSGKALRTLLDELAASGAI